MLPAIAAAVVYGLAAGLTPGPLFALVLRQSLQHGPREGMRTAFAPLLTDGPIVILVVLAVDLLQRFRPAFAILGFLGALYLLFLAYESWTSRPPARDAVIEAPRSLMQAVIVNYLNPNPWIFWIAVGASTIARARRDGGWPAAAAFVVIFLALLVGGKLLLAVIVGRSREAIIGRWYTPTMRCLAILLVFFAVMTARDAATLLRSV
jgi:threonine/homoserine/homoserine lactone efflux protein